MKKIKLLFFCFILTSSFSLRAEIIKNFELPVFEQEKKFKIEEARGKTVVLNFFASWCISCIQEMPELNALKASHPEALFIAVNAGDTSMQIKKLLRKHKFDFLILEDSTKEVSKSLGVNELPRTMIISPRGEILFNNSKPPKSLK